jgi:glycosyltransferase involved in cell wall biosynthesis
LSSTAVRLAVVASHPVQYQAPLFRALAQRFDLTVFFAHRATPQDQADAGFGVGFDWDIDLMSGYAHEFLVNTARRPGVERFAGCDTPAIGARLAAGGFDAVLLLGWHLRAYLQALLAARRLATPVLVRGDSHLVTPRSAAKNAIKAVLYPHFLRLFDGALYVGARSRSYWTHYRYPKSRLFFSPHCVDTEWFAARATPEARIALRDRLGLASTCQALLLAGKLMAFKRPLDLVEAAARLRAEGRDVAVLAAGAGPAEGELHAAARAAHVPLHALGFCNQSQMPAVYAAADILVLPSEHETWGLVANEALACGRPVVLSNAVGAAPDLVGDGTTGRAFPVGDVGALADAIADVRTWPPAPEAFAEKSRMYSVAAAADGIEAAVLATLGRRRANAVSPDQAVQ